MNYPSQSDSKILPIAEDILYLCHQAWRNLTDTQLEALALLAKVHITGGKNIHQSTSPNYKLYDLLTTGTCLQGMATGTIEV